MTQYSCVVWQKRYTAAWRLLIIPDQSLSAVPAGTTLDGLLPSSCIFLQQWQQHPPVAPTMAYTFSAPPGVNSATARLTPNVTEFINTCNIIQQTGQNQQSATAQAHADMPCWLCAMMFPHKTTRGKQSTCWVLKCCYVWAPLLPRVQLSWAHAPPPAACQWMCVVGTDRLLHQLPGRTACSRSAAG